LCPWGRKKSPAQSNLPHENLASSLAISSAAVIYTHGDVDSSACEVKSIHTAGRVTVKSS
jgi:hypothetical protein